MSERWAPLTDIPARGREFSFSDQAIWTEQWTELGLPYSPGKPLAAVLRVLPLEHAETDDSDAADPTAAGQGCLISGRLSGTIHLPCDRCAEEAEAAVNVEFEEFEIAPPEPQPVPRRRADKRPEPAQPIELDETLLRWQGGSLELDVGRLLWEQFVLGLPVKPLCRPDCKGLCPRCGTNRNHGDCSCETDDIDPRLSALRGVKVRNRS